MIKKTKTQASKTLKNKPKYIMAKNYMKTRTTNLTNQKPTCKKALQPNNRIAKKRAGKKNVPYYDIRK